MAIWRCLLWMALACVAHASARPLAQYQHRLFSSVDGAPEQVGSLSEDREGMLWVGAATGVYTFDGQRFARVPVDFRDSPRQPYYLRADPAGGVWIGWMRGGVTRIRNGVAQHFDATDGAPGGTVWSFAFDQDGGVWAAGMEGIARFDGHRWHRMGPQDGFDTGLSASVHVDQGGNVGAFTERGLYVLRKGARQFDAPVGKTETRQVLATGPQGQMYFMGPNGIHRIASLQRYDEPDFPMLYRETRRLSGSFVADRDGGVWFDGPTGLHHLEQPDRRTALNGTLRPDTETLTLAEGFSASGADCMLEDRHGDIWVATDAGLHRFRPSDLINVTLQTGATVSLPSVLAADDGGVWLHTFNPRNTWTHSDATGRTVALYPGEFASPVARDGAALLAVKNQTQVMRLQDGVAQPFGAPLPPGRITAMARTAGGEVWLGTVNGAVLRGNGGAWETVQGLPAARVSMLAADPDGVVWIGYLDNQLVRIAGGQRLRYTAAQGLTAGTPSAIATSGATSWVAGARGLNVLQAGKMVAVTGAPGMFDDLADLRLDRRGGLWLTGRTGVLYLSSAQLAQCVRGCTGVTPVMYDNADGLRSRSLALSQSQLAQDAQGRIWIATGTAVFRLDGPPGGAAPAVPRAQVRGATARGERYAGNHPVQLAAGTQDLQFDYTAPMLDTPERVRFRYRLAGYDNSWQSAGGRRQAFYTGLDPGHYQFELAAAQGSSDWSAPATLAVDIAPSWYQAWWFRILCVVALLATSTLLYRLRVLRLTRRVREHTEARQQERERIARELHDTVLQTNFALLLQVRAVAASVADHAVGQQLDAIVSRAQATLAEGRDKVGGLRAQEQEQGPAFAGALEQLASAILHDSGIAFTGSSCGRPWPLSDAVMRECQAIVAEALTNIRQHAHASQARVAVRYGWRACTIAVSDDGMGIAREFVAGREGHWGLAGMRERAALMQARLTVETGAAGTTIRLRVRRRQVALL